MNILSFGMLNFRFPDRWSISWVVFGEILSGRFKRVLIRKGVADLLTSSDRARTSTVRLENRRRCFRILICSINRNFGIQCKFKLFFGLVIELFYFLLWAHSKLFFGQLSFEHIRILDRKSLLLNRSRLIYRILLYDIIKFNLGYQLLGTRLHLFELLFGSLFLIEVELGDFSRCGKINLSWF